MQFWVLNCIVYIISYIFLFSYKNFIIYILNF